MKENTVSGKLDNPEGKQSSIVYKRPTSERKKKIFANSACGKGLAFQDLYELKNSRKKKLLNFTGNKPKQTFLKEGIHK